jgi:hypothetical protein
MGPQKVGFYQICFNKIPFSVALAGKLQFPSGKMVGTSSELFQQVDTMSSMVSHVLNLLGNSKTGNFR